VSWGSDNLLIFRVWNLGGLAGAGLANTVFTSIGLNNINPASSVPAEGLAHMEGVYTGAGQPSRWSTFFDKTSGAGVNVDIGANTDGGVGNGIVSSCATSDMLPGGSNSFWVSQNSGCTSGLTLNGTPTHDGAVVISFRVTEWFSLAGTTAYIKAQNGGPKGELSTTLNGPPTTTVPEPISMALLGSGLLGVGMVRRRRNSTAPADGLTPA
jgi:hypothetical protein